MNASIGVRASLHFACFLIGPSEVRDNELLKYTQHSQRREREGSTRAKITTEP